MVSSSSSKICHNVRSTNTTNPISLHELQPPNMATLYVHSREHSCTSTYSTQSTSFLLHHVVTWPLFCKKNHSGFLWSLCRTFFCHSQDQLVLYWPQKEALHHQPTPQTPFYYMNCSLQCWFVPYLWTSVVSWSPDHFLSLTFYHFGTVCLS